MILSYTALLNFQTQCMLMTCAVPDAVSHLMDSNMITDTDSHVTTDRDSHEDSHMTTDTDSHLTCSKKLLDNSN